MKVLWTDELKFKFFGSKRRQYVRCRLNERYPSKCIVPIVKHGREKLVWGCFSGLSKGDLKKIDEKIDKKVYYHIFMHHGIPSGLCLVGQGFVYQQDNNPKQSSHLCRKYLEKIKAERRLKLLNLSLSQHKALILIQLNTYGIF